MRSPSRLSYFAADGNYGNTDCVLLITDNWTNDDWKEIEQTPDDQKMYRALIIDQRRNTK